MADKTATIYVIDVGSTTKECHCGRVESDLEYGLRYFLLKAADTIAANRKTWSIGLIAFRTDDTQNHLESEGYSNISILKPLGKMEMVDLENIRPKLVPSSTQRGDAISAIVVAISEIITFTQLKSGAPGKFERKIVLITDGQGMIDDEGSEEIVKKINESGIELVVAGIDFDDREFGFKEESKSFLKEQNELLLQKFVEKCDKGVFGTVAAAIEQTLVPSVRTPKAYLTYEGRLGLGDLAKYPESSMSIEVRRYFKTKRAKPISATRFALKEPSDEKSSDNDPSQNFGVDRAKKNYVIDPEALSLVRNSKTCTIDDPSDPRGRKDVPFEDLSKGYLYGRTIVPINEADEGITKFDTIQSFNIIGFIPSDEYEKYLNMGESCITVAQHFSEKSRLAMSSLVHALHELESYAIARIVPKNGKDPSVVLLAPFIEPGVLEALIDVPLPFSEDVRIHRFPPLDKVLSISGAELKSHRNLPSNELNNVMSDYVDAMNISSFGGGDNSSTIEHLSFENQCNPVIQNINHATRHRAIYPEQPLSLPPKNLSINSKPPDELISLSTHQLQRLITVASVKAVPPTVRRSRKDKLEIKPLSGLDIDDLLGMSKS